MALLRTYLLTNRISARLVVRTQSRGKRDNVPEVNAVSQFHASTNQPEKGKMYDKKPFKFMCEKGKAYMWCSCGHSKTQPFCDGTHKSPFLNIKLRPVRFVPRETKEYWFCNCKQTNSRPFCDGSHRKETVYLLPNPHCLVANFYLRGSRPNCYILGSPAGGPAG
ncbi:CDGSH iron-sulfur domain-containing protein 3, mitochondrial [Daphnia magna]|uniref:CDGSH iron-sulfur domain-containing protein 3, mitochondrial n=1 Tax=Daphnia magna TaxID=35525 RepID=A0A164N2P5_9CRUS|nr:CDGSH iron-sulfur domain-containing protein 3, mitochondrial [Daphnia magna]